MSSSDTTNEQPGAGGLGADAKRICVYLGGNRGREQRYIDEARTLGRLMAESRIGLVYGGARVGLMGVLARTVLDHGGAVTGVVPRQLSYQDLALDSLSELHEVDTMHERKHLMQSLAHACLALPGGFGTLEEMFEALTWSQRPLELHEKPCVFLNIDGYYDHLFEFLEHAAARGLLLPENRALARQAPTAATALRMIRKAWADEEAAMLQVMRAYEQ
ncbi:MAG: TIGR00730 family Rossman fold protein [Acidobacteria bacterium]|nr:TIGR00730 family Rossman fold protein [Acidobacteriota bacterium]